MRAIYRDTLDEGAREKWRRMQGTGGSIYLERPEVALDDLVLLDADVGDGVLPQSRGALAEH